MATSEQLGTNYDLEKLQQTSRDSLHGFIRRFSETRNSIPNISEGEAIDAFTKGLQHEQLWGKLYRKRPTTIDELIQIANGYADAKEAEQTAHSDRPQRCHDDHHEERRYDDHDCRPNDRDRRHNEHDHRPDDREHQGARETDKTATVGLIT